MKRSLISIFFTSLALLLSACGSQEPSAQLQMSPPPDEDDPLPIPSITSSVPQNNVSGVASTVAIRIRFNAPMNRLSVQSAFSATKDALVVSPPKTTLEADAAQAAPPPINQVPVSGSFAWPDSRTLIFTPAQALPLGAWVTVKVNQTAKDSSYRPLTQEFVLKFRVHRQYSKRVRSNPDLDGEVRKYGLDNTVHNGAFIRIGDRERNPESSYGFLSFDLSSLPSSAIIARATLNYKVLTISGDPVNFLGGLAAYGVNYGDTLDGSDYLSTADDWCGDPGGHFLYRCPLAHVPLMGWNQVNITPAVQYDMANRSASGNRSQIRMGFYFVWGNPGIEDFIDIAPAEHPDPTTRPFLELTYLAA
jgi:hypothetical protein